MSKIHMETIKCPKCENESPFSIWESINTTLDPQMKEKVRDGSAFLFTCPHCDEKIYIDYGFLYHQMNDKIMIRYASTDQDEEVTYRLFTAKDDIAPDLENLFVKDGYLLRIVRSLNSLREKIYIFDDDLDDRIIEIYKLFLYAKAVEDPAVLKDVEILYLNIEEPGFELLSNHKHRGFSAFNKDFYEKIRNDYKDLMPELRHDDPIVDMNYAMRILNISR